MASDKSNDKKFNKKLSICLGIDLGTTNTVVSYLVGSNYRVIENNDGLKITPSFVYFKNDGAYEVGITALRQGRKNPKNFFYGFKRLMGQKYSDVKHLDLPYEVVKGENDMAEVRTTWGKNYTPIFLSSLVLRHIKDNVEASHKAEFKKVVITVPAYFNNSQREATKQAGELAGFEVLRMINEPTAAALIADLPNHSKVGIFDLGGGTFDISLLERHDDIHQVVAINGDNFLGGLKFDQLLLERFDSKVKEVTGKSLWDCPKAINEAFELVELAKKMLSKKLEADITIRYLDPKVFGVDEDENPYSIDYTFKRSEFEQISGHLVDQAVGIFKDTLKTAKWIAKDLDKVVLVGGMTRMPLVQEKLIDFLKEDKLDLTNNPDEIVSLGAAKQGAILMGNVKNDMILLDVIALDLGIETVGGIFTPIIERNSNIPIKNSQIFSTAYDNQTSVNIAIYQGNRSMVNENHPLGSFELMGIKPQPRNVPKIKVEFDVDANGILTVNAFDEETKKKQELKVSFNLSKEQVDKMKEEAERFQKEDEDRKKFTEKIISLDSLVYQSRKQMEDAHKDTESYTKLNDILDRAETLVKEKDRGKEDELDSITTELTKAMEEYLKLKHGKDQGNDTGTDGSEEVSSDEDKASDKDAK